MKNRIRQTINPHPDHPPIGPWVAEAIGLGATWETVMDNRPREEHMTTGVFVIDAQHPDADYRIIIGTIVEKNYGAHWGIQGSREYHYWLGSMEQVKQMGSHAVMELAQRMMKAVHRSDDQWLEYGVGFMVLPTTRQTVEETALANMLADGTIDQEEFDRGMEGLLIDLDLDKWKDV